MTEQQAPPVFSEFFGQNRAKALLAKALSSSRVAHAFLFQGPDGVGKKCFAQAMAMALNCQESGPQRACGRCISCRKSISGNHPDFTVVSPVNGSISIESVRELKKEVSFRPYESMCRIVVLEDIHSMRVEAANSLLKLLEEPPQGNILVLTAHGAESVLPTIRSRCQIIPFFPLSEEETASVLEKKYDIEPDEVQLLVKLSEGSPGKAQHIYESRIMELFPRVLEVLQDESYLLERHCATIVKLAGELADLKELLPLFLALLRIHLHEHMLEEMGKHTADPVIRQRKSLEKMERVTMAERQLKRNCDRALVCEILLFRLQ